MEREIWMLSAKSGVAGADLCCVSAKHPGSHVWCHYSLDQKWIIWEMLYSLFIWFIWGNYHKTVGIWRINNSKHILQNKSTLTCYQQTHQLTETETLSVQPTSPEKAWVNVSWTSDRSRLCQTQRDANDRAQGPYWMSSGCNPRGINTGPSNLSAPAALCSWDTGKGESAS